MIPSSDPAPDPASVHVVHVFADGPGGGNPAPTVVDATDLSEEAMRGIARRYGHESGFVCPAPAGSDVRFRFFVPNHEMEMCGHATVGAVWLLDRLGRLPCDTVSVSTLSGLVEARVSTDDGRRSVAISQPAGRVTDLSEPQRRLVLEGLGLSDADLVAGAPLQNAVTSRVKTLVPVRSVATLDGLQPDFSRMESICEAIGSTGLYPYAASGPDVFDARQFPKSSGYPEDAATGIAAAALSFGLLANCMVTPDRPIFVRQGRAMGRPSKISLRFRTEGGAVIGCWLGGPCHIEDPASAA